MLYTISFSLNSQTQVTLSRQHDCLLLTKSSCGLFSVHYVHCTPHCKVYSVNCTVHVTWQTLNAVHLLHYSCQCTYEIWSFGFGLMIIVWHRLVHFKYFITFIDFPFWKWKWTLTSFKCFVKVQQIFHHFLLCTSPHHKPFQDVKNPLLAWRRWLCHVCRIVCFWQGLSVACRALCTLCEL